MLNQCNQELTKWLYNQRYRDRAEDNMRRYSSPLNDG